MFTIGLIDRHLTARRGIELLIKDVFTDIEVQSANDLIKFGHLYNKANPEILILGFANESDSDCLDIINKSIESYPLSNVVVFDECRNASGVKKFMECGINGYLLKECKIDDMITSLHSIRSGKTEISKPVITKIVDHLTYELLQNAKIIRKRKNSLTRREHDIAAYLCQGLRPGEIASLLNLKPSTVSTIKYNVFKKMHVESIVELLKGYSPVISSTPQVYRPSTK